jgi:hypothetical protein
MLEVFTFGGTTDNYSGKTYRVKFEEWNMPGSGFAFVVRPVSVFEGEPE